MKTFRVMIYHRVDGRLETLVRILNAKSLTEATRYGRSIAEEYEGRLVAVDQV